MHILIAPDSFKGSASAEKVGKIISEAIITEIPSSTVDVVPMADGGEGTIDVLLHASEGKRVNVYVKNAIGEEVETIYGVLHDNETVVIEVALIAGFNSISQQYRDPFSLTTYGVGECIIHALDHGYRKFIFCLGGSATNDGGMGMLQALGVIFSNKDGKKLSPLPALMDTIDSVDYSQIDQRLCESSISIASDVVNPLYGRNGATYIFGPQKGVLENELEMLDQKLKHYSRCIEDYLKNEFHLIPGAGAAGGLGFALLTIGAKMESGAELIANRLGIDEKLATSDWVITGEGRTDEQTLQGKLPFIIASMARERQVPNLLISGSLEGDLDSLYDVFDSIHSIANGPLSLEESIQHTEALLYHRMRNIARLLKHAVVE